MVREILLITHYNIVGIFCEEIYRNLIQTIHTNVTKYKICDNRIEKLLKFRYLYACVSLVVGG